MPGFMVSILFETSFSQVAWSCVHGSELADSIGRTKAEPPITMIESTKSTKNLRTIFLPPHAVNATKLGWVVPTCLKIAAVGF